MATIAELIDQELLKKLQELKARLEKENGGKEKGNKEPAAHSEWL